MSPATVANARAAAGRVVVRRQVAPETRLLGAGSLMLAWLEEEALRLGLETIRLNSTGTARSFYMARGFSEAGDPSPGFGITTQFPLLKNLPKHPPENNQGSRSSAA